MNERIPQVPPVIAALDPNESRPLWSVMIPSYNCINFLRCTLESILAQDPGKSKMQIEVVDDCSTDGDVGALVDEIGKGRIAFYRQDINRGSLRNFETCINRSTGKLVHLLHGDDAVKVGNEEPEWAANLFPPRGIINDFLARIAGFQQLQPPSMVVKRSVYERLGSFFAVNYGEDWEMWIRIAASYKVAFSPKCLALYRAGHGTNITKHSISSGRNITDISRVIDIVQEYFPLNKRKEYKSKAQKNFSNHYARASVIIYRENKDMAFVQARGAWKLDKNLKTFYYIFRLYLLHIRNSLG